MPRLSPLPQPELEICRRLAQVRARAHMSRAAFARACGAKPMAYTNYEQEKAKLPAWLGMHICRAFQINQTWLALGTGRIDGYIPVEFITTEADSRRPFSALFSEHLAPLIEQREAEKRRDFGANKGNVRSAQEGEAPLRPGDSTTAFAYAVDLLEAASLRLPVSLHWHLFDAVVAAIREIDGKFADAIQKHAEAVASGKGVIVRRWKITLTDMVKEAARKHSLKNDLTKCAGVPMVSPDMLKYSTWPELREKLHELLEERGAKARLAEKFGVTVQAVSDWLRGVYSPEADKALALRSWVCSGAKLPPKPKRAAVVRATAAQARPRKGSNDENKPQSRRRKT